MAYSIASASAQDMWPAPMSGTERWREIERGRHLGKTEPGFNEIKDAEELIQKARCKQMQSNPR
jgi:hypothetical protein